MNRLAVILTAHPTTPRPPTKPHWQPAFLLSALQCPHLGNCYKSKDFQIFFISFQEDCAKIMSRVDHTLPHKHTQTFTEKSLRRKRREIQSGRNVEQRCGFSLSRSFSLVHTRPPQSSPRCLHTFHPCVTFRLRWKTSRGSQQHLPSTALPVHVLCASTCWETRFRTRSASWRASWGRPPKHCQEWLLRCRRASPRWRNLWWAQGRSAFQESPAPTGSCRRDSRTWTLIEQDKGLLSTKVCGTESRVHKGLWYLGIILQ